MNQSTLNCPAFWKPFMFSFSFCPHFIHYVSQKNRALSAFCCCCCCCWLFTAGQQIALWWIECCSIRHPCPLMHMHTQTTHAYSDYSCFLFLFSHAFGTVFICVCISSFYVLLTAEWHRQVSWLGQFGWYNCYYQHPTFRRIPGSHTNLSNLMLKWYQAPNTRWALTLAVLSNAQICRLCYTSNVPLLMSCVFAVKDEA